MVVNNSWMSYSFDTLNDICWIVVIREVDTSPMFMMIKVISCDLEFLSFTDYVRVLLLTPCLNFKIESKDKENKKRVYGVTLLKKIYGY